jgi:hypothetical protein
LSFNIAGFAMAQEAFELKSNSPAGEAFDVRLSANGEQLELSTLAFNIGESGPEIIGGETGSRVQRELPICRLV